MSDEKSRGEPSKDARERYNEQRRQKRAEQKQSDKQKKTKGAGRTRNFATIVYPESVAENWQDCLANYHVPAFVSPLHEDMNPDNEVKKPHYHVIIMFESVKTDEQAQEIVKAIGGVGVIRIVHLTNYSRYLCHMDDLDPNKKRYNPEDVVCIGGADYYATISRASDKYNAIFEMVDFCEENNIDSYRELFIYARLYRNDWARVLCDNGTYVIKEYLKSKSWENEKEKYKIR